MMYRHNLRGHAYEYVNVAPEYYLGLLEEYEKNAE